MKVDVDQLPKVGNQGNCLGVREPPNSYPDVEIDTERRVLRNRKGLSVSSDWRILPGFLIPEHLEDGYNGAKGKNLRVFAHGAGFFKEEAIDDHLALQFKEGTTQNGVVGPATQVTLPEFQNHLAATRNFWIIDES